MNCPNCGAQHTIVKAIPEETDHVVRIRWCPICHCQFDTEERLGSVCRHQAFQASLFQVLKQNNGVTT